jgi:hypothetical protein
MLRQLCDQIGHQSGRVIVATANSEYAIAAELRDRRVSRTRRKKHQSGIGVNLGGPQGCRSAQMADYGGHTFFNKGLGNSSCRVSVSTVVAPLHINRTSGILHCQYDASYQLIGMRGDVRRDAQLWGSSFGDLFKQVNPY